MANKEIKLKTKRRGRSLLPDNEKLSHQVNLRFTDEEMATFTKKLEITSNVSRIGDLLKRIIFNRKIVVYTRDKDLDITISEIVKLRNEMNAIGKNYNQIAKRINTYNEQFLYKKEFTEIEKHFDQFKELQNKLICKFDLLADKWLQK